MPESRASRIKANLQPPIAQPLTPLNKRRQIIESGSDDDFEPGTTRTKLPQSTSGPTSQVKANLNSTTNPSTRRKKRRNIESDSEDDLEPVTPSPPKKARTPRSARTPSKPSPDKQAPQWNKDWKQWANSHIWVKDRTYEPRPGSEQIHRTEATKLFPVNKKELDALPYTEFRSTDLRFPSTLGRSYSRSDIEDLAARKYGMKAGLHTRNLEESELLHQGGKLANIEQAKRIAKAKNPKIYTSPEKSKFTPLFRSRKDFSCMEVPTSGPYMQFTPFDPELAGEEYVDYVDFPADWL